MKVAVFAQDKHVVLLQARQPDAGSIPAASTNNMKTIYLKKKDLVEAESLIFNTLRDQNFFENFPSERVPTERALLRFTSTPVIGKFNVPNVSISAMDGVAVKYQQVPYASPQNPVKVSDFAYVNTGEPVPDHYNAVIKIEDIEQVSDGIVLRKPVKLYENIRLIGEDTSKGRIILPAKHIITAQAQALMLQSEIMHVEVYKRPFITIIPTGNEMRKVGTKKAEHEFFETNSFIFKGYAELAGANVTVDRVVKDNKVLLQKAILSAVETSDMVFILAGTSHGGRDITAETINDIGELLIHGINLHPGKPFIFSMVAGKPVFGLPGYPQAAFFDYIYLIAPVLSHITGIRSCNDVRKYHLTRKLASYTGMYHAVPLSLGKIGNKNVATPLKSGSGILSSIVNMDGFTIIPPSEEGFNENEPVDVRLARPYFDIEANMVFSGSSDYLIEILQDMLSSRDVNMTISSIGSLGGLIAVKKGYAHLAGSHLYDSTTNTFNIPFIKKFHIDEIKLFRLCLRKQGFIVKKGNPKGIKSFEDIVSKNAVFVNRQSGSGTRVQIDNMLKKLNINPGQIMGYSAVESTHTQVAIKVKSGFADVGVGVEQAACMFGLDFIPLFDEEYDLIVRDDFIKDARFKTLIEIIKSKALADKINKLCGYKLCFEEIPLL